jgi:hypothetical protein
MGHIKEPMGIDFFVDPTPLSNEDRKRISELIAHYRSTGKKMQVPKVRSPKRPIRSKKTSVA